MSDFGFATIVDERYEGRPVSGRITDRFGTHSAWRKAQGLGPHTGVDIAAPEGTALGASAPGKFVWSGWTTGGLGFVSIVDYGQHGALYAHQREIYTALRPGQAVSLGTRIGTVGNTGTSFGAHVHWMASRKRLGSGQWDFTRAGGGLVDPLSLVSLDPPLEALTQTEFTLCIVPLYQPETFGGMTPTAPFFPARWGERRRLANGEEVHELIVRRRK